MTTCNCENCKNSSGKCRPRDNTFRQSIEKELLARGFKEMPMVHETMKRLHELNTDDIVAWQKERMRVGQQRYGNRDLKRYNLVDVVEELLDALNILERLENRARVQGHVLTKLEQHVLKKIQEDILVLIGFVRAIDNRFPDELCTDENGGERIWWGEK